MYPRKLYSKREDPFVKLGTVDNIKRLATNIAKLERAAQDIRNVETEMLKAGSMSYANYESQSENIIIMADSSIGWIEDSIRMAKEIQSKVISYLRDL